MHHSYEGLDRAGGVSRRGLLAPLRHRDFRLLWSGMCVSLLGDGAFLVALAWQVYQLSDAPTAMGMVGIAMTVPTIVFLIVGGVLSDRLNRRHIMLAADVARLLAAGALAVLSLTGTLEIWHVAILVAVYGTGQAFFAPAFDAIVPDLVPEELLGQANALDQLVRPIALRMVGPALGGILVGAVGAGGAFALDAASFAVSAVALLIMRPPTVARTVRSRSVLADLRDGWRFVRRRRWLWVTFASAAFAYLLFMGPVEVLVPYVVKHDLGADASDLGLIFGAGGLASILTAVDARPARAPTPEHDVHLPRLDGRDAGRRGLRPGHGRLAPHARQRGVQRARDRGDDRLGHGEATATCRRACWVACRASTG